MSKERTPNELIEKIRKDVLSIPKSDTPHQKVEILIDEIIKILPEIDFYFLLHRIRPKFDLLSRAIFERLAK